MNALVAKASGGAVAKATRANRAKYWGWFVEFCDEEDESPHHPSEGCLARFLVMMADIGKRAAVPSILAAVREKIQLSRDPKRSLEALGGRLVKNVVAGVARGEVYRSGGSPSGDSAPINKGAVRHSRSVL